LAFTDADCVVSRGWLRELATGFAAGPQVGGVAGEILAFPPKTPAERYMAMTHPNWQQRALASGWPFAATANVAYRRSTFRRIGVFDPRLISGEDKDFGWRFFHDGQMELRYNPKAIIFHRHHTTVRAFVRQHLGWSYGNALLHAKYDLPWGARDELRKYGDLVSAAGNLIAASARYATKSGDKMDVYFRFFDVLRTLTYRAGALRWMVTHRSLRAKFADGDTPGARR
ncbi:MAG TPA: glycosyltransferase family 2 protein, partial [Gemmatimonadaceae bacterium]|nr:glycosyltransferase family 2 protein [Gemmatimonadaceae bacterium]